MCRVRPVVADEWPPVWLTDRLTTLHDAAGGPSLRPVAQSPRVRASNELQVVRPARSMHARVRQAASDKHEKAPA